MSMQPCKGGRSSSRGALALARLRWAWRQWAFRPGMAALNVGLLALGLALFSCLMQARTLWQDQLARDLAGTDLVIGPKGSPLQLVLAGVYHLDSAQGTVPLASLAAWGRHPLVADWLPLALGDQAQGFRIVGAGPSAQAWHGLSLEEGGWSTAPMDVVLGAEVARRTGWPVGHRFQAQHGLSGPGDAHDHPYRVAGIAKPVGTVADRLIFTPLASVAQVHGLAVRDEAPGEARGEAPGEAAGEVQGGAQREPALDMPVSLALYRFRTPLAAALLPPQVQRQPDLQAARPSLELARLQAVTGAGELVLQGLAGLMLVMALLASAVGVQSAVQQRLPDLAMLRMLGAAWPRILAGLGLELAWTALLAWGLAMALSRLGLWALSVLWMPGAQAGWGWNAPGWADGLSLALALGLVALSLLPAAWRLRQMDVMQVLGRRG